MKFRSKGVSQIVSSLMIIFLLLTALTTYIMLLQSSYNFSSKAIRRNQEEVSRSMENILIKPRYSDSGVEYVLTYEGLKPTLKYIVIRCDNNTIIDNASNYDLEFGKPIPQLLIEKMKEGCNVILISSRGKVYGLNDKVDFLEILDDKISIINNLTKIANNLNNISQILPFLNSTILNVDSGKIYVLGPDGKVLYELNIIGNLPIYDIIGGKKFTTPLGKFLQDHFGTIDDIPSESVFLMKTTLNNTTVFKLELHGDTPNGELTIGPGVYLVYLTGEAYDGSLSLGERVRVYTYVYYENTLIGSYILDGTDEKEYYFRGLKLNEWSNQFDGIFALIIPEGSVTLKYRLWYREPVTRYIHHTLVVEKIADIGGEDTLKILKLGSSLFVEYKGYLLNSTYTSGNVEGEIYELGSYIVAPIGYIINGTVARGEPIPVTRGRIELTFFKPLIAKPIFNPLLLGVEVRYEYVELGNTYNIYRQVYGDLLDQIGGSAFKIVYDNYDAIGNIYVYARTHVLLPSNYYITLNILEDESITKATFQIIFDGVSIFKITLPTASRSYVIKVTNDNIKLGVFTVKIDDVNIHPFNVLVLNVRF